LFYFYNRTEKVRILEIPYFLHVHLQHCIPGAHTLFHGHKLFIRAAFPVPINGHQRLLRKPFSDYDISGAGLYVLWLLNP
jgi:hypothetical protein